MRVPVVLVVDDEPTNVHALIAALDAEYVIRAAHRGDAALRAVKREPRPDLILLDVHLPDLDGYAVLRHLKREPSTRDIPVLFVTASGDADSEERGFDLGAADYIRKPVRPKAVRARVRAQLAVARARTTLQGRNALLEAEVALRMRQYERVQRASIRAIASLAEMRDTDTGEHILRTQHFVRELAHQLQDHPRFAEALDDASIDLLVHSAPLHDIGKVGIPDEILLKPGVLTSEEWETMKGHSILGAEAIARAESVVDESVPFLTMAREIARSHHERWDGGGYPDGLKGEAIPIPARLMALADVFDALISPRVYKAAMSFEKASSIIEAGRGAHFDPDVVDAFIACHDAFIDIANRYAGDLTPPAQSPPDDARSVVEES